MTDHIIAPRPIEQILEDIRAANPDRTGQQFGSYKPALLGTLARLATELADALAKNDRADIQEQARVGGYVTAPAWILDDGADEGDGRTIWVLAGVDDLTGMACYAVHEEVSAFPETWQTEVPKMRTLAIEDAYGIAARGPDVLLSTKPAGS